MPVFSQKEFKASAQKAKALNNPSKDDSSLNEISGTLGKQPLPRVLKKEKQYIYHFFHPENGQNEGLYFEDEIVLEGIKYKRSCENGILKVKEKPLADFLKKKGYILIKKNAITNTNRG